MKSNSVSASLGTLGLSRLSVAVWDCFVLSLLLPIDALRSCLCFLGLGLRAILLVFIRSCLCLASELRTGTLASLWILWSGSRSHSCKETWTRHRRIWCCSPSPNSACKLSSNLGCRSWSLQLSLRTSEIGRGRWRCLRSRTLCTWIEGPRRCTREAGALGKGSWGLRSVLKSIMVACNALAEGTCRSNSPERGRSVRTRLLVEPNEQTKL